jgi:calcium binding protein 39
VALSYVVNNKPQVLLELCRGYDHKESATPAGSVLREVLKNEAAAAIILFDDGEEPGSSAKGVTAIERERPQSGNGVFWRFFDWIDKSSFEVAADAFTTFRVCSFLLFFFHNLFRLGAKTVSYRSSLLGIKSLSRVT